LSAVRDRRAITDGRTSGPGSAFRRVGYRSTPFSAEVVPAISAWHTGVSGRKAIFEALIIDQEVQAAIQDRAPTREFRRIMASRCEPTLFQAAIAEAAKGIITIEEACKFRELGVEAD
jgi:type II secretory ATPase GspE/PulE/Tfp pilus assembly ATPase PilB-like protein